MLAVGCSGSIPVAGTTTGEPSPGSSATTTLDASSGSTTGSASGSTTSVDVTTSSSSTAADETYGQGFINEPDGGTPGIECSTIEQDCPRGEKCNAWADDGGSSWNAAKCFPIDEDPDGVDEPCAVVRSAVSGVDSCALGSICWDLDPQTLEGTCMPYCTGSNDAPVCDDPNRRCHINAHGVLALCIPQCDPLDRQACPEGQGCYPVYSGFWCAPDASGSGGAAFEACEFVNACAPGLFCADAGLSLTCPPGSAGCCLPVCSTTTPDCPGAMVCEPWFEPGNTPAGYEHVGICRDELPED